MPSSPSCAFPYGYTSIEATIARYLPDWSAQDFDAVVAIARGGLIPATLIASELDLPLLAVSYQRATREVQWWTKERPVPGGRLLLVEDIAGRGTTLSDCLQFLEQEAQEVRVFSLAYDRESRMTPDYGQPMPDGMRAWFPWERESITDAFSQTENLPTQPPQAYAAWAIDLDGILLQDIPEHSYLQDLEATLALRDSLPPFQTMPALPTLRTAPVITGRPECDRNRTQQWLDRHGFSGPLLMRDPARHTAAQSATHKAEMLLQHRYTHFLESDAAQALIIASITRIAAVFWWNGERAMRVHACETSLQDNRPGITMP